MSEGPAGQQPITVTYSGADVLVDSTPFSNLISSISHHLPLRNIHWRPSASQAGASSASTTSNVQHQSSIRTIQSLGVRLEPLSDTLLRNKLKPETRHLVQRSLLERPYCHLYFVVCDDNDAYRTQVRNDIRSWLATIQGSPTISAATVTSRALSGSEVRESASTPRSGTPPIRPDTPNKDGSKSLETDTTSSKERFGSPSPEFLIVLLSSSGGSNLPASTPSSAAGRGSPPVISPTESAEKKTGLGRFYSSTNATKGSVIDKMKADFNSGKRERVVHLNRLPNLSSSSRANHSDPTVFADLLSKLKESVSTTFDAVVEIQSEVARRESTKKTIPGWNFCKWMAEIECIASTFEGTGLYADALVQYEEVEAVFFQCMRESNLAFFSQVGGNTIGDDSAPLLDVSRKPYRDLILRNEISLFDFRCYLFAKRANLMGKLGRVAQVMAEAPGFLAGVASMLEGESLAKHFVESWTFSSALDIVEQCQAWLIERGDVSAPGMAEEEQGDESPDRRAAEGQLSAAFHAAKAELLEVARRQLDKIGMSVGHLPRANPFVLSAPLELSRRGRDLPPLPPEAEQDGQATSETAKITRQELLHAVDNRELFDLHYVALTERVVAGWISGRRKHNVMRLRAVLGSLDFFRGRYEQAYTTFTSLSEAYAQSSFSQVEASHLTKQLACHSRLGRPYDRAWVSVVVALLKTRSLNPSGNTLSGDDKATDESIVYMNEQYLFSILREKAKALQQEIPVSHFDLLSVVPLDTQAKRAQSEDGSLLDVQVINGFNSKIEVDDVRICLANGQRDQLWFTSGKATIAPGLNVVQLRCPTPESGKFSVDVSQIRYSKVVFQYSYSRTLPKVTFIDVPEDGDAFYALLDLPRAIKLDEPRCIELTVETGRNTVSQADVRMSFVEHGRLLTGLQEAKLFLEPPKSSTATPLQFDEATNTVKLKSLASSSTYKVLIPLADASVTPDGIIAIALSIDYWTENAHAEARRQLRKTMRLSVGLPLGVNVQDFFRQRSLFSKFTISAGGLTPLRMGQIKLSPRAEDNDEKEINRGLFDVISPDLSTQAVVTPRQPASYVFCIRRTQNDSNARPEGDYLLRLKLGYRTLAEEARDLLELALEEVLAKEKISKISFHIVTCLKRALRRLVSSRLDTQVYTSTGQVQLSNLEDIDLRKMFTRWGLQSSKEAEDALDIVRKTLNRAACFSPQDALSDLAPLSWRSLEIIVEVPSMGVVNSIDFNLIDAQGQKTSTVVVGRPIRATITISTSFSWRSFGEDGKAERPPSPSNVLDLASHEGENSHTRHLSPTPTSNTLSSSPVDVDEGEGSSDFENAKSEVATTTTRSTTPDVRKGKDVRRVTDRMLRLSYDVTADFENWLVGGKKRNTFEVPQPSLCQVKGKNDAFVHGNTFEFELVPAKAGSLLLPTVNVWPIKPAPQFTPASQVHHRPNKDDILNPLHQDDILPSCETYVANSAQVINVLPTASENKKIFWIGLAKKERQSTSSTSRFNEEWDQDGSVPPPSVHV